jgi:hypothetical protein
VNLLDRLALNGRRFEKRRSAMTGSTELTLAEVLRIFKDKTVLELESLVPGKSPDRVAHATGRPVSIVDGVAAISTGTVRGYEVLQTPPSGDYSRVKIHALPDGGHLSCLIGRRMPEHTTTEDPLLETLRNRT